MQSLDSTFSALSDATRRAILSRLAKGEATVMELAEPFAMSQPDDVDVNEILYRPTRQEL